MALNLGAALSAKYAGVPGWMIAGGVAVVSIFVVPKLFHGGGSSSGTQGGAAPAGNQGYALGFNEGFRAGQGVTPGTPPPPTPPPPPRSWWPPLPPWFRPVDPPPVNGHPFGVAPSPPGGWGPGDRGANPSPPNVVVAFPRRFPLGVGGAGAAGSAGDLSKDLYEDHHPLVDDRLVYPHFVRGVGGPAAREAQIHAIARQTQVHPARIQALNPDPEQPFIRVG